MRFLQMAWWRLRRYARWFLVSAGLLEPRTVVLVGLLSPYDRPKGPKTEIWGCNRAYKHQPNLDRLYFFDDLPVLIAQAERFVEDLNDLGVPVFAKKPYSEIVNSQEFPLKPIIDLFGIENFTSTIAYQIAHAMYEGADKIVLHMFQVLPWSVEYFAQKTCIDYWCGVAQGAGIHMEISGESAICHPYPWESRLYGYIKQDTSDGIDFLLARAARQVMDMPWVFRYAEELPEGLFKAEAGDRVIVTKPPKAPPKIVQYRNGEKVGEKLRAVECEP